MWSFTSNWFFYLYFSVWAVLSLFSLHRLFLVFVYYRHKNDIVKPKFTFKTLPHITIQLPVYNEKEVILRLLDSVAAIDYPKDLLDIQVLDDSTDECGSITARKVKELALSGVPIHHIQRSDRTGFKAGALRNGMKTLRGEFIFILDADFIPPPDILLRTIHYFTDTEIGCVQMRWEHINRDFSLLTRVQAMLLDGHFAIEQTARNKSGCFFNFNGTAGIWRKRCVEEAGGWQNDTLTEDLDLSYRAQLSGWKFLLLPHITIPGELPVLVSAFKIQQHRWAKGAVQTARKLLKKIWTSSIPFKVKMEASFHLTINFSYPFILLLVVLLLPVTSQQIEFSFSFFPENLRFLDYPLFFMATLSVSIFYLSGQIAVRQKLSGAFKDIPFLLAVGVGMSLNNSLAVLEGLFANVGEFKRTPKRNVGSGERAGNWGKTLVVSPSLSIIEMFLGFYFLFLIYQAISLNRIVAIPFLLIFYFGFTFIGFYSWFQIERK